MDTFVVGSSPAPVVREASQLDVEETFHLIPVGPTPNTKLKLSPTNLRIAQDGSEPPFPGAVNLLAITSRYGFAVIANEDDLFVYSLETLRRSFTSNDLEPKPAAQIPGPDGTRITLVRLANMDRYIVAGYESGEVAVWDLHAVLRGETGPLHIFPSLLPSASQPLIDLLPNPEGSPELVAAIVANQGATGAAPGGEVVMLDVVAQVEKARFGAGVEGGITAGCWSVRGKQISCGYRNGEVVQCTPDGVQKLRVLPPPELVSRNPPYMVLDIQWLENVVSLVTYAEASNNPSDPAANHNYAVYAVRNARAGKTEANEYIKLSDDEFPTGAEQRPGRRWATILKDWEPFKHIIATGNAPYDSIDFFGTQSTGPQDPLEWAVLKVAEQERPTLPADEEFEKTCLFGLALDLTATEPVVYSPLKASGLDESEEVDESSVTLPPLPILYAYTNEGVVLAWHVANMKGGPWPGLIKPSDIATAEVNDVVKVASPGPPSTVVASTVAPMTSDAPASGQPAFGQTGTGPTAASPFSQTSRAFSSVTTAFSTPSTSGGGVAFGKTSTFGQTGFGGSAFGQTGFGSKPALAFGQSGQSGAPAFGQTGFGAAPTPAFGQAGFFNRTQTTSTSASSTTGGFAAFAGASASAPAAANAEQKPSAAPASGGFGAFAGSSSPFAKLGGQPSIFKSATSTTGLTSATTTSSTSSFSTPAFGTGPRTEPRTEPVTGGFAGAQSIFGAKREPIVVFGAPVIDTTDNDFEDEEGKPKIEEIVEPTSAEPTPKPRQDPFELNLSLDDEEPKTSGPIVQSLPEQEKASVPGPSALSQAASGPSSKPEITFPTPSSFPTVGFGFGTPEKTSTADSKVTVPSTPGISPVSGPLPGYDLGRSPPTPSKDAAPSVTKTDSKSFFGFASSPPQSPGPSSFFPSYKTSTSQPAASSGPSPFSFSAFPPPPKDDKDNNISSTVTTKGVSATTAPSAVPATTTSMPTAAQVPLSAPTFSFGSTSSKAADASKSSVGTISLPDKPKLFGESSSSTAKAGSPLASPPVVRDSLSKPLQASLPSPSLAPSAPITPSAQKRGFATMDPSFPSMGFDSGPLNDLSSTGATSKQTSVPTTRTPPALSGFPSFRAEQVPRTAPQDSVRTSPASVPTPQAPLPPILSTTAAPKVSGKAPTGVRLPEVREEGLTGEFLRTYLTLEHEMGVLGSESAKCSQFIAALRQQRLQGSDKADFMDETAWSFGDLPRLTQSMEVLQQAIDGFEEDVRSRKRAATELQSQVLKAETKREEAARFIRARKDPEFAKMDRVRQLGPEQQENQKKILGSQQAVKNALANLEERLRLLKRKVTEEKQGRSSFKVPLLDHIHRSMRNITTVLVAKSVELDELAFTFEDLNISTEVLEGRSSRSSVVDGLTSLSSSSVLGDDPAAQHRSHAMASEALNSERSAQTLKKALLSVRTEPLFNRNAAMTRNANRRRGEMRESDLQLAFAKGPITAAALPPPRKEAVLTDSPGLRQSPEATSPAFTSVPLPMQPGASNERSSASTAINTVSFSSGSPTANQKAAPFPSFAPPAPGPNFTPPTPFAGFGFPRSQSISPSAFAPIIPSPLSSKSFVPDYEEPEAEDSHSSKRRDRRQGGHGGGLYPSPNVRRANKPETPPQPSEALKGFRFGPPPAELQVPRTKLPFSFEGLQAPKPVVAGKAPEKEIELRGERTDLGSQSSPAGSSSGATLAERLGLGKVSSQAVKTEEGEGDEEEYDEGEYDEEEYEEGDYEDEEGEEEEGEWEEEDDGEEGDENENGEVELSTIKEEE